MTDFWRKHLFEKHGIPVPKSIRPLARLLRDHPELIAVSDAADSNDSDSDISVVFDSHQTEGISPENPSELSETSDPRTLIRSPSPNPIRKPERTSEQSRFQNEKNHVPDEPAAAITCEVGVSLDTSHLRTVQRIHNETDVYHFEVPATEDNNLGITGLEFESPSSPTSEEIVPIESSSGSSSLNFSFRSLKQRRNLRERSPSSDSSSSRSSSTSSGECSSSDDDSRERETFRKMSKTCIRDSVHLPKSSDPNDAYNQYLRCVPIPPRRETETDVFVSSDPLENRDNSPTRWRRVRDLKTDKERKKFAKEQVEIISLI
jgi:hypothetical protein